MGALRVAAGPWYQFEDHELDLLRLTIIERLLARRPVMLHIHRAGSAGRIDSVLIVPETAVAFFFDAAELPPLDRADVRWMLDELELTGALRCAAA
ncbi:hypothetical protein KXS11_17030 [Plantibacter flavus]|uniref:DUF7882 family protein n=1 Tax=Plantibacter flavus TaxID=150123 RepID=UPI003F18A451